MKIQIIKYKQDDLFIFVNGKLKHRSNEGKDLLKLIGELTKTEIVLEEFPGDALFRLVGPKSK